jgi:hypothetical protein
MVGVSAMSTTPTTAPIACRIPDRARNCCGGKEVTVVLDV